MFLEEMIVDYTENKEDIKHWTTLKGEFRYERIIDFMKKKNVPCTWKNVTNYVKYDKRLLINTFKYIVFIEEFYKSMIYKNETIRKGTLLKFCFSKTIDEYLLITGKKDYDENGITILEKEKETINSLRNSVAHNKILIDRKYNGKELDEALTVFVEILPSSYRNGFIKDINACSKGLVEEYWYIEL